MTIQCSFLGSEFMQGVENFKLKDGGSQLSGYLSTEEFEEFKRNPTELLNLLSSKTITLPVIASLGETKSNFNDMGFI